MNTELLLSIFAIGISVFSLFIIGILVILINRDRSENQRIKDEEQEYLFEMMMINRLNSIYTELELYFSKNERDYTVVGQNKINQSSIYQLKKIYVAYYTRRMYDELIDNLTKKRDTWYELIDGDLLEEHILRYFIIMLDMIDYVDKNEDTYTYESLKDKKEEFKFERYNIDEFIKTTREKPIKKIIYDYRFKSIQNIQIRTQ